LEGGLPAWKAAGGPVDTTAAPPEALSRAKQAARQQVEGATKYKAHLKHDKVG
jgi:3-mercaptopyruvate sulfurtransferase SseA